MLHNELHWLDVLDWVFFKPTLTVHRCLNGRASSYLSAYCVQVKGADLTGLLGEHKRKLGVWGTEVHQRGLGAEPR